MSDTGGTEPTRPLPSDDEVARLRADVARLTAELERRSGDAIATGTERARGGWWRAWVAAVLVAVAAILTPVAVVAIWARDEVGDTDRYVDTVAPLAHDPAVQAAVTARITDEIFTRIDVEAITGRAIELLQDRGLGDRAAAALSALQTPLVNGIQDFVERQVADLVASEQFADAWEVANREAHGQMVGVLTGKTDGAVEVSGTTVRVNLATVINAVKARLVDRGFTVVERLPTVNAQFTIFQSADLPKVQRAFRLLDATATALPIIVVVLLVAGVWTARRRRRAIVGAALAIAATVVLTGLALNLFREVYLDALPPETRLDAAAAIYDQFVLFIRFNLRALFVVFLAIAAIAWLGGPGEGPTAIRRSANRALDSVRHRSDDVGMDTGRFGLALGTHKTLIRGVVLGGAVLVYVMRDHPTGTFALVVLGVALVLLLVLELLARSPAPVAESAPAPAPAPPPVDSTHP